jgi:HK97 family phage portal protein
MKNPLVTLGRYLKRSLQDNYGPEADYWYYPVFKDTQAGVPVEETNALTCSDVFKCVRVISETASSIPLILYRWLDGGGKERAEDHYLSNILKIEPNPLMTSMQYREVIFNHLLTWGNHYSQIIHNGFGRVDSLWPLRPDRMEVKQDPGTAYGLIYRYRPSMGGTIDIPMDEVLHFAGLGFNGIIGYSPIALHRESIALSMAAAEFASRFFGNDATPGGILEHPGKLGPVAHENLKKALIAEHSGGKNRWKPMILEEGMKWNTITVPMKDAQFIDIRKYQRTDICGIYRVPPHLIGDLDRATFTNIEHESMSFVTNTIRPWCVRFEQTLNKKLLGPIEKNRYFFEHLLEGLMRGDVETRYKAYAIGRNWGWLCADDIREIENMNPLPKGQGKIYLVPLNMIPADQVGQAPAKPIPAKDQGVIDVQPVDQKLLPQKKSDEQEAFEIRNRLMLSFRRLFEDGTARIVRREVIGIKKALNRPDYDSFYRDIDDFYKELPLFIMNTMSPIVSSFNELSNESDGAEILNRFIIDHIKESRSDIQTWEGSLIQKERFEKNDKAIETKLNGWVGERPVKEVEGFYRYNNGILNSDKVRYTEAST